VMGEASASSRPQRALPPRRLPPFLRVAIDPDLGDFRPLQPDDMDARVLILIAVICLNAIEPFDRGNRFPWPAADNDVPDSN